METFTKNEINKDMGVKAPPALVTITYGDISVEPGMTLTPTQVRNPPEVSFDAEAGALYTLIMNDPDAPSRKEPSKREWHHWMVGNIPGSDLSKGEVRTEYVGSAPPNGSGLHRYVFLVYKQPGKIKFKEEKLTNRSGKNRASHSAQAVADKYKMEGPVAGNFYQAEYDDYCNQVYKQLSGK